MHPLVPDHVQHNSRPSCANTAQGFLWKRGNVRVVGSVSLLLMKFRKPHTTGISILSPFAGSRFDTGGAIGFFSRCFGTGGDFWLVCKCLVTLLPKGKFQTFFW